MKKITEETRTILLLVFTVIMLLPIFHNLFKSQEIPYNDRVSIAIETVILYLLMVAGWIIITNLPIKENKQIRKKGKKPPKKRH